MDIKARVEENNRERVAIDQQIAELRARLATLNREARALDAALQPNVVQGFVGDAPKQGVVAVGTKDAVAKGAIVRPKLAKRRR